MQDPQPMEPKRAELRRDTHLNLQADQRTIQIDDPKFGRLAAAPVRSLQRKTPPSDEGGAAA
jgi:hypothetical protein